MISSNVENLKNSIRELYKKDIELTGQNKDAIIQKVKTVINRL